MDQLSDCLKYGGLVATAWGSWLFSVLHSLHPVIQEVALYLNVIAVVCALYKFGYWYRRRNKLVGTRERPQPHHKRSHHPRPPGEE